MLTRFVRIQLIIFTIASIIGVTTMVVSYLQVPTLLGIGQIQVTLELPRGGGLYRLANVTYRGAQIGKVAKVKVAPHGAEATLLLDRSTSVPADLVAQVRSVSAVGEQYVDLRPRSAGPPYLANGSVISIRDAEVPQPVGPMLDRTSALLASVPGEQVSALLDETARAFDDADYDIGSVIDSAAVVAKDSRAAAEELRMLIDDSRPLLDGQIESEQDTRTWTRSLANVTDQLVINDPQVRTILASAPGALGEVTELLDSVRPTLPVLLANLTSVGQVAVTYLPSLEQLLVLVPPFFADLQAIAPNNNATGLPLGNFRIQMSDPPACTVGFLPPSQWRSPADTTTVDTPEGLYCKLPQDSPIAVRGARNLPCMARPGKRAPTVEICDSDEPYVPLAMRQHALGPAPFDPNLVAQGESPDDRTSLQERIFGPLDGTPLPADAAGGGGEAPPSASLPPPSGTGGAPAATPSSVEHQADLAPAVSVRTYDPRTGRYLAPDGTMGQQSNLATAAQVTGWQDLVLAPEHLSP